MTRRMLALFMTAVLLAAACPVSAGAATRSKLPYSAVAYMEIEFACGCTRTGTGTMICKNALLTAGHNLLCSDHNRKAETIDFWFGYTSKSDYHYRYSGRFTYTYYCNFSNGYNSADDIGYVVFKSDVGEYTGWLGTRWYSNADSLAGISVRTIGFSYGSLRTASGTLRVRSSKQVSFRRENSLGAEGGPVYCMEGSKEYRVLAVYTSFTDTEFYARRLTESLFDDMKRSGAKIN